MDDKEHCGLERKNDDIGGRINVRGTSGSGKTTFGRELAGILGVRFVEMDDLYWKPDWEHSTMEEFCGRLEEVLDGDRWVLDGNYSGSRGVVNPLVETMIWLDYPFWVVFGRIVRRTVRRGIRKELLWGKCRERLWPQFFSRDSIIWWSVKGFRRNRRKCRAMVAEPPEGMNVIRLGSPGEAERFLEWVRAGKSAR